MANGRIPPRLALALAAAAAAAGCSMTTPWFIHKSLRDAGFSRAEARCAVDGIAGQLSPDQLWSIRAPLAGYIMLDEPAERMDVDRLLDWLRPQLAPEVHRALAHYASHCRTGSSSAVGPAS